jgi:hypothetical protein
MAAIASSSLTVFVPTVFGNKRIVFASYTPTTAAGSDTVNVGLTAIDFVTGNWGGTTTPDAACQLSFSNAGSSVVVTNTTHANHPVSFVAVGR